MTDEENGDYNVVQNKFEGHFVICRNAIFEEAKFSRRSQDEGEIVDSFITWLYCLAEYCECDVLILRNDSKSHCSRDSRYITIIEVRNVKQSY